VISKSQPLWAAHALCPLGPEIFGALGQDHLPLRNFHDSTGLSL